MDTVRLSDPLVGLVLDGRYRLARRIARGGTGTVYEGLDVRLDREVAVKVLHAWADGGSGPWLTRFTAEAKAAARLATPETVAIFDQGHDAASGHVFLVMELVRGGTLRDLLVEQGAQSPGRTVALLEPVLRALSHAHGRGMVHRDIKPENVLLGNDGSVKVTDFGLARAIEPTHLTSVLIGTVAYLSPEQLDDRPAGATADVYAAGILAFELLTGAPPWTGSPAQVIRHHAESDVPPPSTQVSGVPEDLDALVVRATRRDPAARPADAGVFLAELLAASASVVPDPVLVTPADPPAPDRGDRGGQSDPAGRNESDRPDDGRTRRIPIAPTGTRRIARRVPTADPAGRRRPPRALLAALTVLLLAVAGTGAWWQLEGRWHDVPGLLQLSPAQAEVRLEKAGLTLVTLPTAVFDEQVPSGRVVSQEPRPGARTTDGPVRVTLSKGPDRRAVPDLSGQDRASSEQRLTDLGLRVVGTVNEFSDEPEGVVLRTDPSAGSDLRPGAGVTLVLSKGTELLDVPDVRGVDQDVAKEQLSGFTVLVVEVFDDAPVGTVVRQAPDGGQAERGSSLRLSVSKGPDLVDVPDVVDVGKNEARDRLEQAGFQVRVEASFFGDTVRSTSPDAGQQARRGSTVTMYVS